MKQLFLHALSFLYRKVVIVSLIVGVLVGIVAIGVVRFVAMPDHETHYHANFAVFINGERVKFDGPQYFQEISACDAHDSPLGRTHMHDENDHLVHVHAATVTWSEFFTNLGWSLNNSMLYDGKTAHVDGQDGRLSFVLNGKPTRSIANEVIGDQDRLLVNFGSQDDATLQKEFSQVQSDAKKADETADPATCQGPEHTSVWTRLRQAFFF